MADETTTTGQPGEGNADGGGDGQTTGQPGEGNADGGGDGQKTFTQEQLDDRVKLRLKDEKERVTRALLADLGAEDIGVVKQALKDAQAAKEAQMSELEKAQAQIAEAQAQATQAATEAEVIKTQAAEALLKAAIISQAGNFNDANDVWLFIDRAKIEPQEDGSYKGIDEALKTLAEAKPYLIKIEDGSPGPGTPARAKQKSMVEKLFEDKKKAEAGENRPSTIRM